jgi:hypothetical protein
LDAFRFAVAHRPRRKLAERSHEWIVLRAFMPPEPYPNDQVQCQRCPRGRRQI